MKRSDWLTNNIKKTLGQAHRVSKLSKVPFKKQLEVSMGWDTAADQADDMWLDNAEDTVSNVRMGQREAAEIRRRAAEGEMRRQRMANEMRRRQEIQRNGSDVSSGEWRERYLQNMQNANGPFDRPNAQQQGTADNIDFNDVQRSSSQMRGAMAVTRALRGSRFS